MKKFLTDIDLCNNNLQNPGNIYTKSETDTELGLKVDKSTKINGHELSGDITLTPEDLSLTPIGKYSTNIGDGSTLNFTITHGLAVSNALDVIVSVYEIATKALVFTDVTIVDANSLTITFATAPTINQYRVVVIG